MASFLCRMTTLFVAIAGIWQSIIGVCQLLGLKPSLHAHFTVTGTFYNPGPLGGFIAMSIPIWLAFWMEGKRHGHRCQMLLSAIAIALEIFILAITCSRAGWIAAIFGCLLVVWSQRKGKDKKSTQSTPHTSSLWLLRKGIAIITAIAMLTAFTIVTYKQKPNSADGRVLMWKIGLKALLLHPNGVGWHQVPGAYGDAQEQYFATGNFTEEEKMVAGSPKYLFNEYLQVGLAWGISAMLLMIFILIVGIAAAIKCHESASAGGILAFAIFAFASYPLQFTIFHICVALLLIGVAIALFPRISHVWKIVNCIFILTALIAVTGISIVKHHEQQSEEIYNRTLRILYTAGADNLYVERAIALTGINIHGKPDTLTSLGNGLIHNASFLFELGHSLNRIGRNETSNRVLNRAIKISADPMILNIIAKNYISLGQHKQAELWLLRSINRLPSRMYPHYLLAQLYADGPFANRKKLYSESRLILDSPVKIMSPAVEEMRSQAKKWLREQSTTKNN